MARTRRIPVTTGGPSMLFTYLLTRTKNWPATYPRGYFPYTYGTVRFPQADPNLTRDITNFNYNYFGAYCYVETIIHICGCAPFHAWDNSRGPRLNFPANRASPDLRYLEVTL